MTSVFSSHVFTFPPIFLKSYSEQRYEHTRSRSWQNALTAMHVPRGYHWLQCIIRLACPTRPFIQLPISRPAGRAYGSSIKVRSPVARGVRPTVSPIGLFGEDVNGGTGSGRIAVCGGHALGHFMSHFPTPGAERIRDQKSEVSLSTGYSRAWGVEAWLVARE